MVTTALWTTIDTKRLEEVKSLFFNWSLLVCCVCFRIMVDEEFINEVEKEGADICGEKGEYHTLVIDGPIFGKRIAIKNTRVIRRHEVSFVELLSSDVEEKGDRIKLPLDKKNKERYELS